MAKLYHKKTLYTLPELRAMRSVLSDWYGSGRADVEMNGKRIPVLSLSDYADDAMKELLGPEIAAAQVIADKFNEIMGDPLCKFTSFSSLKNRTACIEVSHPAWLRELNGPLRARLIEKINAAVGRKVCDSVSFVPSGRG
ncbi:MAG: DciA family protein [Victivallaceae bacterium]|nr:DciA family protein [Victivallaceae bacterium]